MEQLTIFDYLGNATPRFELGKYLSEDEAQKYRGRELRFQELQGMLGDTVLLNRSSHTKWDSLVPVRVLNYHSECDRVYRLAERRGDLYKRYGEYVNGYIYSLMPKDWQKAFLLDHICDRVEYCDREKSQEKSGISEMYCSGGRWKPIGPAESFYEIS